MRSIAAAAKPRRVSSIRATSSYWKDADQPWVFNLATQEDYWRSRATYTALEQALMKMRSLAGAESLRSIAMPRIGVGYGSLSWRRVREIVERVFADWAGAVYVYEEYVPATAESLSS